MSGILVKNYAGVCILEFVVLWIFRIFDALRGPSLFENIWRVLTSVSSLTEDEIQTASSVIGKDTIKYEAVRIAESGLLKIIFKIRGKRAFTAFHTINLPRSGKHSRKNLDIVLHELIHVYQFEQIGSIYIWQSLRAQRTNGYKYGGWQQLKEDWDNGKHLHDYNLEQQGQIAQDYYNEVVVKGLLNEDPVRRAYEPFIDELRNGEL